jgi:hypothetical protein
MARPTNPTVRELTRQPLLASLALDEEDELAQAALGVYTVVEPKRLLRLREDDE